MTLISQIKSNFEADLVWGESQMQRGGSKDVEPCAKPGCQPFPQCCVTNTFNYAMEGLYGI